MPIYAYRCENCGFQKDALQKVSDSPLRDCPSCGQPRLAKQLTAAGFSLKGSGWYVTDFRDSGKKSAAASSEAATSTPAASAEATASTPAATPAAASSATPTA